VNVVVAVVADKRLPPRALTGRSAAARRRRGCRVDQPLAKVGGAAGPRRQALGIRGVCTLLACRHPRLHFSFLNDCVLLRGSAAAAGGV